MGKPTPQDAELLLRLYEIRREPEMRKARVWFQTVYQPKSWEETKPGYLKGSDEDRYLRMVSSYWSMVASMVNLGILNEDLFFSTNGEHFGVWAKVKNWVEGARKDMRPSYLKDLEILVAKHEAWRKKHWETLPHEKSGGSKRAKGKGR